MAGALFRREVAWAFPGAAWAFPEEAFPFLPEEASSCRGAAWAFPEEAFRAAFLFLLAYEEAFLCLLEPSWRGRERRRRGPCRQDPGLDPKLR